jgi:hypothetical protein
MYPNGEFGLNENFFTAEKSKLFSLIVTRNGY